MIKQLIGWLMFLANSEGIKDTWYSLKDKLCKRYGINNGYDIQFIEGKQCYACNGTGKYKTYYNNFGYNESCYKCYGGWYKRPCYVLLERIKVGNHVFHKPIRSEYSVTNIIKDKQFSGLVIIDGYISHKKQKYGWLAFSILYILFDFKGYIKYIKTWGRGWRVSWWLPKNWLYNLMHIRMKGFESYPVNKIKKHCFWCSAKPPLSHLGHNKDNESIDTLPF